MPRLSLPRQCSRADVDAALHGDTKTINNFFQHQIFDTTFSIWKIFHDTRFFMYFLRIGKFFATQFLILTTFPI